MVTIDSIPEPKEWSMKVYVCMPELGLKKAKVDRELYVVSFASDLRGESNHRPPAVGASNKTLATFTPAIEAAMKFFVIAASNIFHKIDKTQPPQLGGDGIVLYPPADPEGMLALHISIVESDAGARHQAKLLEELFAKKEVKAAIDAISEATGGAGPIPAGLLGAAMGVVTAVLPNILKNNKDDVLLDYDFSGRDMAHYHGSPEGRRHGFENKKSTAAIMVYTE
jgi:hypothetical protein